MRLVFDIQSLQSASRLRGIGRYTQSLIAAINQNGHSHEVILLLNGSIDAPQDSLITELETLLPGAECVVCHLPGPSAAHDSRNLTRQAAAELIREAFICELQPDLVHVFSAMEGYGDNVVTSLARLHTDYPVTATFYDLIPLLNPQEYLGANHAFKYHYSERIDNLKRADGLLAISHFSAGEAAEHLHFPREKISVASLGPLGPSIAEGVARDADIAALKAI
ncbi:MAG: glycosyltransferase, partial [Halieaceae bacterium]|nr:glycosyltransferase [Halieaceae bacterium]